MAIKEIPLTKGFVTIVDEADYEWLNQWSWSITSTGYAHRKKKINKVSKHISMGRFILNAQKDEEVDHINGNPLDNRRCNLRICNSAQNKMNQGKRRAKTATSKYKGVYKHSQINKWVCSMRVNGKSAYLGCFDNEKEAAKKYNEMAIKLHGDFARLNIIDSELENIGKNIAEHI